MLLIFIVEIKLIVYMYEFLVVFCKDILCMYGICLDILIGYFCYCSLGYVGINCDESN